MAMAARPIFQLIRIAALLAVIFAAGIVIGRYTAPEPDPLVISPAPRQAKIDSAVRIMAREYEFDEEKEAEFRKLMERMEEAMRSLDRATAERRDEWRRFLPEIRSFVPEHLMDKFDAQTQRTERRMERMIRMRERNQQE
jgi:hypothetical protein